MGFVYSHTPDSPPRRYSISCLFPSDVRHQISPENFFVLPENEKKNKAIWSIGFGVHQLSYESSVLGMASIHLVWCSHNLYLFKYTVFREVNPHLIWQEFGIYIKSINSILRNWNFCFDFIVPIYSIHLIAIIDIFCNY